jgi:predicted dehydrogenase
MATRYMTRLGLVGFGKVATSHLEVFRALGADVVAACARSERSRERARAVGGIKRTYPSAQEMVAAERLDGVVCCVAIDSNYTVARSVIPFGLPLLLEKPPGTSLDEIRDLQSLAESHNTPVMVALNRLWYSVLHKAVASAGGLAEITTVSLEWSESPQHLIDRGFRSDQIERRIFSNSLHGLSLLTMLAGPVSQPQVVTESLGDPFRWLMAFQGISDRGVLVSFQSTWDSPAPWRLVFSARGRRYVFEPLEMVRVLSSSEPTRELRPDPEDERYKPGFYRQAQEFIAAIATRDVPPICTFASIEPAMALASALTAPFLTRNDNGAC